MSDRLTALRSERDRLEAAADYSSPVYEWLVEEIETLEAAEPATPPGPASTTEPTPTSPAERIAALERDMREASLHPERLSDAQRHSLVTRVNNEVRVALDEGSEPEPESVDVAELQRQMLEAAAKGNALDPDEAAGLVRRFDAAVRGQVDRAAPAEELRGLLQGQDVEARYVAGAELARRGLLADDVGEQMIGWLNQEVRAAGEAGPLDPERVPEAERDLVTRLRDRVAADEAELRGRLDPRDQLTSEVNRLVRQAVEQARERDLAGVTAATIESTEGSTTEEA